ncbi:DEAD/DEAH box helicase [Variovorax sp. J22P168]|uniref:DEAD/DEAH box helicase n=1 Tax=Variovorax jilinensis TaxID=3053513 RepID=UPI0025753548|nr:DEAD/DEAH box helicase [Variovorax sp. J22P168]MDM0012731.1 DEAD/DEAH box helicase [Variovorax sp. J22P168]
MTDAFEAQGEFAPVQSDDFAVSPVTDVAGESNAAPVATDTSVLEALDAVDTTPAEPKLPNGFVKLGLAPELIAAVEDLGFTQPTTVQEQVIPRAMTASGGAGRFVDLMVSSQTGSGKTAAFLLPVLHTLLQRQAEAEAAARAEFQRLAAEAAARGEAPPKKAKRKDPTNTRNFKAATPGALILCPTRELAQQVAHDAIDLVKHCRGLRIASVVGGMPYQLQIAKLQNADLVVATPGRLLDLQRSMQIKLDQVKFLVVDEADRMLDLGFADDLAEVNQLTIERQQTMMFSATFAPRIQQLAQRVMREPQRVTIDSPQEKHANIKQSLFWADSMQHKRKLLDHWLRDTTINQAIVFASTQVECDGLANDLQQDGFSAVALHGALSQGLRNRRLMALRQGQVQILVATDVAARGIDVPTITHVFNYGLPMKAEDYTHRIGRTGRAGRDGLAITFAEQRDRRRIFDIEAYTRQQFKSEVIPGLEPQQRAPQSRPQGDFGGRGGRDNFSRDRKFGGAGGHRGGNAGGYGGGGSNYAGASGFNDRNARGPGAGAPRGFQNPANAGFGGGRDEGGYGRKPGWGDNAPRGNFGGGRGEGFAPRGGDGFAPRGHAGGHAGHGGGGKVFVPRDAQKPRGFKPTR